MTQHIQFIYLTQNEYNNSDKTENKLYFTSDTNRIYKGQNLFGGGSSIPIIVSQSIDSDEITVNGVDVSVEGHRHNVSDIDGLTPGGITPTDVPTKTSDLINDSGFIDSTQANQIVTQRVNDAIQAALDAYYGSEG